MMRNLKRKINFHLTLWAVVPLLWSTPVALASASRQITYDGPLGTVASGVIEDFAVGDLDGDGDLDFILAGKYGTPILVSVNAGSGLFDQNVLTEDPGGSTSVVVGDFNADGAPDFVVGLADVAEPAALWGYTNDNTGSVSFGAPKVLVPTNDFLNEFDRVECYDVAVGDMNQDGADDIVVLLNFDRAAGGIAVLENNNDGTGNFTTRMVSSRESFDELAVADLDADGYPDILLVSRIGSFVIVYHNKQDGSFAEVVLDATAGSPRGVTFGDVDGDGDLDIATVADNQVVVYENTGFLSFVKFVAYKKQGGLTFQFQSASLLDANGDGLADVVFSGVVQGILFQPQIAPKTFGPTTEFEILADSGLAGIHAFCDVNGDGVLDLVATHKDGLKYVLASEEVLPDTTMPPTTVAATTMPGQIPLGGKNTDPETSVAVRLQDHGAFWYFAIGAHVLWVAMVFC